MSYRRVLAIVLRNFFTTKVFNHLKQPKESEEGKVYLPRFFAILGAVAALIFLIPAVITAITGESLWVPIAFFAFSLFCTSLIIAFLNCRIFYTQDGFTHKNFFGIKRKFTYEQVTAIKENTHEKYIYIGKRRIMVDEFSIGGDDFIKLVKEKYQTIHNGKNLPKMSHKTKFDIFKGNVKDPAGFVIAYVLFIVISIWFLIYSIYPIYVPSTPDNTIKHSTRFVSCEIKSKEIILTSSDNQLYKICFIDRQFNAKEIQNLCDEKKVVTTYSDTPWHEKSYYPLKAIVYNDTYLLSFEETNRLEKEEYILSVVLGVAMSLAFGMYVIFSIIVGRNPKKFSKQIVKLFFKNGYIKY